VAFLCLLCACLPSLNTLRKQEYISLSSILNAIIGIASYCVILKMVMLHDAIKTIENGVFVFFLKNKKRFSF